MAAASGGTVVCASTGWSCRTVGGETLWSAWGARGIKHGTASSVDDAKEQAAAASEILEGSDA